MRNETLKKKIEILEHSLAESAGAYYSVNLTRDLVPGYMYQVIDGTEYCLNEQMGLPENARFSDVVAFWGEKLSEDQKTAYFDFLSIPNLLHRFEKGETHVFHKYWTKSAVFEPMLAEQHIVMFMDEETGDVLAITYVLDLTQKFREEKAKKTLEEKQQKLELALKEAEQARKYRSLQEVLGTVDDVLDNLKLFDNVASMEELNQIMPRLLASLGSYSMSDRAYLFTWTSDDRNALRMTHEWCADGVRHTMPEMQNLRLADMPNWTPKLTGGEAIVSMNWEDQKKTMPEEYALFEGQDLHAVIMIPILVRGELNGCIGFDNPERNRSELSLRLLTSIGGHIGGLKENLTIMEKLEQKQQSLENSLRELNKEKKILDVLSIDYTSVYYCDLMEDTMIALKQGCDTNAAVADQKITVGRQSFSFRIQYYFDHFVVKESAPDFVEKLSAEYLMEYLKTNKRFAYRFRTYPNPAGQEFFEVQIARLQDTDGFKVIMGYRYIDDIIAEQEKQKIRLEKALADATINSEIINSISKLYWLIYRIDVVRGTYEEISAGEDMHRLTGRCGSAEEILREARESVVAPEHQEMMKEFLDVSTLQERLRDTESVAVEYHAIMGSWHLARFIVKKRDRDGQVTNVLYVVRQIDAEKQKEAEYKQKLMETAEDARRANMAKTDFLRRMSHDIRTPINGILGMIAIADHYSDDVVTLRRCRDKVKEAVGFLLDLVNNVLDMNKLESGSITLEHKPFNLFQILREISSIAEMNGEARNLTISFQHEKTKHFHLIGSPLHLKQILQNVAGNAVKYNKDGGTIQFSTEEISCENGRGIYRFTCSDSGRGMSPDYIQHAFEPFSQEEDNARTSYMGTGLGLTITKQLVEMMGGTIEVESKLGVGTVCTLTIPMEIDYGYKESAEVRKEAPDQMLEGVKVLLAEDNELNMEIAKFILEDAGIEVTMAKNGKEAVDLFASSDEDGFDLILMDIMMPVMDGLTATKLIREMNRSDAKTIPIFAMTANAFTDDIVLSKHAGMNEHLSKPLNVELLMSTIRQYVEAKNEDRKNKETKRL
ncbi:hybrid sensor histidine kinase/response regulator [Brotaphodocola sp.]|uniref:hybrid sensor histidine kinase/response regulator n=1 Tax=Brotaphodocola sp. TaxID=3073577 RepID=UPI003D7E5A61